MDSVQPPIPAKITDARLTGGFPRGLLSLTRLDARSELRLQRALIFDVDRDVRVLVNALFLIPNQVGGSETYLRGVVRALGTLDAENVA